MWGVHTDRYETDFLGKGVIALGWNDVGDLARLQPTRDAFRDVVEKMYPGNKPGAIANWAGQLFRFVHEMKVGDIVVYPHRWERTINIGVVDGGYFFAAGGVYRQQRNVTWKRTGLARTQFSQGALYEVGSALTLFSVRSHALEFEAALEGEVVAPPVEADGGVVEPATEDEPDAERIFETTRDFVVRVLATELKGHPLAHFVAHLL